MSDKCTIPDVDLSVIDDAKKALDDAMSSGLAGLSAIEGEIDKIANSLNDFANGILDELPKISLQDELSKLIGKINAKEIAEGIAKIREQFGDVVDDLDNIISKVVPEELSGIVSDVNNAIEDVTGTIDGAISDVNNAIEDVTGAIDGAISDVTDSISDLISGKISICDVVPDIKVAVDDDGNKTVESLPKNVTPPKTEPEPPIESPKVQPKVEPTPFKSKDSRVTYGYSNVWYYYDGKDKIAIVMVDSQEKLDAFTDAAITGTPQTYDDVLVLSDGVTWRNTYEVTFHYASGWGISRFKLRNLKTAKTN